MVSLSGSVGDSLRPYVRGGGPGWFIRQGDGYVADRGRYADAGSDDGRD